jgi:hypothetical protein
VARLYGQIWWAASMSARASGSGTVGKVRCKVTTSVMAPGAARPCRSAKWERGSRNR